MRKTLFSLPVVLLCALLWFGSCYAAYVNLLVNGDFEGGLNDWFDLYGIPADLDNTRNHTAGGQYSAKKYIDSTILSQQDYWSQLYQDISLSEGEPVYAQIFIKTSFHPLSTARAGLMLQYFDEQGNEIGHSVSSQQLGGTLGWRKLALSAPGSNTPAGTVKARLSAFLWALKNDDLSLSGQANFDDAVLKKQYVTIYPPASLCNPGFENGFNFWEDAFGHPTFIVTSPVYSGTYAAAKRIEGVVERNYYSTLFQDVRCSPGASVTAIIRIKADFDMMAKATAGFYITFFAADGTQLGRFNAVELRGQTNWRTRKIIVTAPDSTAKIRLSGYVFAPKGDTISVGGVAYFDAARLSIENAQPLTVLQEQASDGGE